MAVTLTFISAVSPGLINIFAACGPASSINRKAATAVMTVAASTRLKIDFMRSISPAP